MALFRRKREPADRGQVDSRSKRGGIRRTTQEFRIDLTELEKRAAPAPGTVPTARVDGQEVPSKGGAAAAPGPRTQRVSATARPHAAVSRRTTRISGRGTPIGELLIQAGAVNQEQVNEALRTQQKEGGLLGQILVEMAACRREDIATALGKQFRFTQVDMGSFEPRIDALLFIPLEKCKELKVIPFERLDQLLCVAMVNVLNRRVITQIETLTKLKVKGFTSTWPEIQQAVDTCYVGEVEEGAKKVDDARSSGLRIDEFAEKVAADIQKAAEGKDAMQVAKAAAMAAPAAAPAEAEAEKYIDDAQALQAQGKLEEAVRRLEAGASAISGVAKLTVFLNQLRGELKAKQKEERERLTRVAQLLARGRADSAAEDFEAAVQKFQEAAKLDPENRVLARELANAQRELLQRRAEEVARKKAGEAAEVLEGKRRAEEAQKRGREIEELLALAEKASEADRFEEAESRLKDVLSLDPEHDEAAERLEEVEAELAEREKRRAEELAAELAKAQEADERSVEDLKTEEERKRRKAHIDGVLHEVEQDREAGRIDIALRKLQAAAEEAPEREDIKEAISLVEEDLDKKHAEEDERRKVEEEDRRKAEEQIRRRAAAAAEVQAERRRMGMAALGGERRLDVGAVTEGSLVEIKLTPETWHAKIAEALTTEGAEAGSAEEALKQLPVAQRYARSREELKAMDDAARAAMAALEDVEEITVGDDEAEIEAILEAIPEDELAEEDLAEIAEVVAIPETRAQAEVISEEEFARLSPELEPDPVLEWLVTCGGLGRAEVVLAED